MKKACRILYIASFLMLCLIPSAGLLLGGREDSAENSEHVDWPSFFENGKLNLQFLPQAGTWFEENFAWRQELVTANAKLQAGALQISSQDGVILGTDGWLYYTDSLNDYTGRDQLSDRALYDIARTAKLTQEYCSYLGADFLFTIVPNKATLYPEHMPYYYAHRVSAASNRIRLKEFLQKEGVRYLDLTDTLEPEVQRRKEASKAEDLLPYLYHKRDSHWTAEGAAMAADAILDELGIAHRVFAQEKGTVKKDFQGDLDRMLYPAAVEPEEEIVYDPPPSFEYTGEVESNFDYFIQTVSAGQGISLLMYRDSFGNALLPFLAENFGECCFSRATPYDVLFDVNAHAATAVVEENAERNLPDVASRAPILQGLPFGTEGDLPEAVPEKAVISSGPEEANPYFTKIRGILDQEPEAGTLILADPGDGILYEAMPVYMQENGKEAFILYVPAEGFPAGAELEKAVKVYSIEEA